MVEQELLNPFINKLREIPGFVIEKDVETDPTGRRAFWDAILLVEFARKRHLYGVAIKNALTTTTARHIINTLGNQQGRHQKIGNQKTTPIIFADYINDLVAVELENNNIDYVDTAGNMLITKPTGAYINVRGKKPEQDTMKTKGRLTQLAGLKILTNLLIRPETIDLPQRAIGIEAGVALGAVANVIRELRAGGYIEQTGPNTVRLIRKQELLEKWVTGYADRLRQKQFVGRFNTQIMNVADLAADTANTLNHENIKWAYTGTFAEDALINYYRTEELVIFVDGWNENLLQDLKWIPARDGRITVLRSFGEGMFQNNTHGVFNFVAPLLIYGELIADGDDRAKEAARRVYDRFLKDLIGDE